MNTDSLDSYIEGSVNQQIKRAITLKSSVSRPISNYLEVLFQQFDSELNILIEKLEELKRDSATEASSDNSNRFNRLQNASNDISIIEYKIAPVLIRTHADDEKITTLIKRAIHEIGYPLLPPTISCISNQLYEINCRFNLLLIPPAEHRFLLQLPLMFHEICHPILNQKHDSTIKPFIECFISAYYKIDDLLTVRMRELLQSGRSPDSYEYYFQIWIKSLVDWCIEFFCDLFALYAVGPAYGWSLLHTTSRINNNPYHVPLRSTTTHPCDSARITIAIKALRQIGYHNEAQNLESVWSNIKKAQHAEEHDEYHLCFDELFFNTLTKYALEGYQRLNCRVASSNCEDHVFLTLNNAWKQFLSTPQNYEEWEDSASDQIFKNQQNTIINKVNNMNFNNVSINQGDHSNVNIGELVSNINNNGSEILREIDSLNVAEGEKRKAKGLLEELKKDLTTEAKKGIIKQLKELVGSAINKLPMLASFLENAQA